MNEALCIGCDVDYEIGYGICSSCPEVYEDFLRRDEPEGSRVHYLQGLEVD